MTQYYSDQAAQILENMSDAFYSVDSEWRILYVNRRAEWNWNMTRGSLIGRILWEVFPSNRNLKGSLELMRAMVDRTSVRFETYSPYLKTYVEVNAYPNQFGGIDVYFHNITDQRVASDAKQTTDQMLRLAIDATGVGFWEWDLITDILTTVYSSPNMPVEWHNGTLEECLNTVNPDHRNRVLMTMLEAKRNCHSYQCEYQRILPNGSSVWIDARGEVIRNIQGHPVRMLGLNRDITEIKRQQRQEELLRVAEETASRERELLEILDGASDGCWILDMVAKTKTCSMKWKKLRGTEHLSPAEEFEQNFEKVHPDDIERVRRVVEGSFAAGLDRGQCEYRVKTIEKGYIWVLAKAKFTYNADGTPLRMYGASTDITGRKEMELALQAKAQVLQRFYADRLQEFVAPLSVLLLAIDLLSTHLYLAGCSHKEKLGHDIAVVRQNVLQMHKLISNLMDISRLDGSLMTLRVSRVDAGGLVRELVETVRGYLFSKKIMIEFEQQGEELSAPMDQEKIQRVLLNLLSNAARVSRDGGTIKVCLRTRESGLLLSVKDDGPGIPAELQAVLFEPFRQASQSNRRDKDCAGIGLALVKALVELMRGRIWLHSEPNAGSEYFVELPVFADNEVSKAAVVDSLTLSKLVETEFSDVLL